jgi:hypothetical protein
MTYPDAATGALGSAPAEMRMAASGRFFGTPATALFLALQILDTLSTVIGVKIGAQEANVLISWLMQFGVLPALVVSKAVAVAVMLAAVFLKRDRVIIWVNYWFASVVGWNLAVLFCQAQRM